MQFLQNKLYCLTQRLETFMLAVFHLCSIIVFFKDLISTKYM